MSRRNLAIFCGLAVIVLVASVAVPALRGWGDVGHVGDLPVFEVRRGDLVRRILAEGNLVAAKATPLGPPAGNTRGPLRIAWLEEDGSRVREGDVVIRFDPTDMEKDLEDGQSEQATTDSRITQREVRESSTIRNLERDSDLAVLQLDYAREFQSKDEQIFSRVEIIESEIDEELATERKQHADDAREIRQDLAQVELDLLNIERRKADLKVQQAEEGLQELEVRAPHDGIFVLKEVWGNVPEVGGIAWGGNTLAEIPELGEMEAEVFVLEADAGGLEVGLGAELTVDANPDSAFQATIKKVDALAKRRFRRVPVQYFSVVLELEQTDPQIMKPGQRVQATLFLGEHPDVLAVPRQAVFEHEGRNVAYVHRVGKFEPVDVELGPATLGLVVVESGLEEGDLIALHDPNRPLRPASDEDNGNGGAAPVAGANP
jgi:multidrug efflux pump subunit AcrA (membrane-fusion protein)